VLVGAEPGKAVPPQLRVPSGTTAAIEFTVHHPITRVIRAAISPLPDASALIVAQDVTDARRIDEIRRDFVANASHEMKTPVAGILAAAETLPDAIRDDPPEAQRFAGNLAKEARRLSNIIQDLLDLARLDQVPAEIGVAHLSDLVRRVIDDAAAAARAKRLTVRSDIASDVIVAGRPNDLELLARNLLDNAIRYTPEGGAVSVSLRRDDGKAFLAVHDSGIGIPAKDLPRIFERFYRVDRARARETGGTGLGLSIVRHIAESHGGSVTADSELGRGSTFTVSLPVDVSR
jgi:two-component system sensor histidine kinase SenX3